MPGTGSVRMTEEESDAIKYLHDVHSTGAPIEAHDFSSHE